jgi:hypothetical protein
LQREPRARQSALLERSVEEDLQFSSNGPPVFGSRGVLPNWALQVEIEGLEKLGGATVAIG